MLSVCIIEEAKPTAAISLQLQNIWLIPFQPNYGLVHPIYVSRRKSFFQCDRGPFSVAQLLQHSPCIYFRGLIRIFVLKIRILRSFRWIAKSRKRFCSDGRTVLIFITLDTRGRGCLDGFVASSVVHKVSSRASSLLPSSVRRRIWISVSRSPVSSTAVHGHSGCIIKMKIFGPRHETANGERSFKAPTEQVSEDARGSGCVMHRCVRRHNVTISHEDVGEARVKRQTLQKSESLVRSVEVRARAGIPSSSFRTTVPYPRALSCALSRLISHVESTYAVRY